MWFVYLSKNSERELSEVMKIARRFLSVIFIATEALNSEKIYTSIKISNM